MYVDIDTTPELIVQVDEADREVPGVVRLGNSYVMFIPSRKKLEVFEQKGNPVWRGSKGYVAGYSLQQLLARYGYASAKEMKWRVGRNDLENPTEDEIWANLGLKAKITL